MDMKNQPNKATVKDGLPTAERILNDHLWMGTEPTEAQSAILAAMQEYSDQQNAELREQVSSLTHQRDFYRKKLNEAQGVSIAKYLGIHDDFEMAPIVQSDTDELRERVKELEGTVSELRTAFANYWVSEGCSCCRDSDNHRDAEHAIGELLGVAKHDDESGYDFNQYQTIYK